MQELSRREKRTVVDRCPPSRGSDTIRGVQKTPVQHRRTPIAIDDLIAIGRDGHLCGIVTTRQGDGVTDHGRLGGGPAPQPEERASRQHRQHRNAGQPYPPRPLFNLGCRREIQGGRRRHGFHQHRAKRSGSGRLRHHNLERSHPAVALLRNGFDIAGIGRGVPDVLFCRRLTVAFRLKSNSRSIRRPDRRLQLFTAYDSPRPRQQNNAAEARVDSAVSRRTRCDAIAVRRSETQKLRNGAWAQQARRGPKLRTPSIRIHEAVRLSLDYSAFRMSSAIVNRRF